jgi:hypothetical protein
MTYDLYPISYREALRYATASLTRRWAWGIKHTSFYAATARKLAVCLFGKGVTLRGKKGN